MGINRKCLRAIAYLVVLGGLLGEVQALVLNPVPVGCPGIQLVCPPGCTKITGNSEDACANVAGSPKCCEYTFKLGACIKQQDGQTIVCATGEDIIPESQPMDNHQCDLPSQDCKPIQSTTGVPGE